MKNEDGTCQKVAPASVVDQLQASEKLIAGLCILTNRDVRTLLEHVVKLREGSQCFRSHFI